MWYDNDDSATFRYTELSMIKFCEALVNVNFLTAAASRCGQTYTFDSRFAPEKLTAQYTGPCSMGWRILLRIFSMRISIASHAFREGSSVVIVYRELSSLVSALGFSAKTLYGVSNRVTTHYRQLKIPKSNGGFRTLHIPDQLLKSIQRQINLQLLLPEPVSPFATAYRPGGSTRINALPHVGKPIVLKLDIDHFFDHAFYPLVKEKGSVSEALDAYEVDGKQVGKKVKKLLVSSDPGEYLVGMRLLESFLYDGGHTYMWLDIPEPDGDKTGS